MAIPIRKFGQYVLLEVHTEAGELIFSTDSMKVDFDIRHIEGWSRAKISVTNLAPDFIKKIGNSGHYATVTVALHDAEPIVIADRMYVSNALEERQVPNIVFNMYCYSKLRRAYLEHQIDVQVTNPSIRKTIDTCIKATGFGGAIEYKHFPEGLLDNLPPKPASKRQGSLLSVLESYSHEQRLKVYTIGNKFVVMYQPTAKNVTGTDFYTSNGGILLSTTNMRSNPKIGPATLKVHSNLDPRITPTTVLDISNLLTLGTDTSQEALEVAEDILRNSVAGFSKYQTLSVQHKGSNWTGEWSTHVGATSPTPGLAMNTDKWWA